MKIRGNVVGTTMKPAAIANRIGGGAAALVVTVDGNAASHTAAEIYAHLQDGGVAVLRHTDAYFCIEACVQNLAICSILYDDYTATVYSIYGDGSVETVELMLTNQSWVEGQLGNISTALDNIIVIQEHLIGGGEV